MIDAAAVQPGPQLIALAVVLLMVALMGAGLTWAILRAARFPQPIMRIIVMSLLTVVLVGIYVVVDSNDGARQVVATMAATSLGALVTATASTFKSEPPKDPDPPDDGEAAG